MAKQVTSRKKTSKGSAKRPKRITTKSLGKFSGRKRPGKAFGPREQPAYLVSPRVLQGQKLSLSAQNVVKLGEKSSAEIVVTLDNFFVNRQQVEALLKELDHVWTMKSTREVIIPMLRDMREWLKRFE